MSSARPNTLFFSWKLSAASQTIRVKVDYCDVRLGLAAELFAALGQGENVSLPVAWGRLLKSNHANYVGVALSRQGPYAARVYFTLAA